MTKNVTRLSNGVRLVTEHMPGVLSTSIGIWVGRGARHESLAENGIAHFLEHMAFKGTNKRSARQIAETIEDVGGYLNAYTAKDTTAFYARVLKQDTMLALDVLADILMNSQFAKEELEVERGVILQEIGQSLDTPDDIIFDWLAEESYPEQALGRPILGTTERVKNFQAEDFRKFINANYGGENLVISAAGGVDHNELAKEVENLFANLNFQSGREDEVPRFVFGQKRVEKELEQAHFALSLPTPGLNDDNHRKLQLISNMLGGGISSRLFQSIREEQGLCYTIFSSLNLLRDSGQMIIYSGTSGDAIATLMSSVAKELNIFANEVSEAELARAKAQLRAGSVMGLESSAARAERNARQIMVDNKLRDIEEALSEIEAISLNDIQEMSARFFIQKPQMVVYGPIEKAPDFNSYIHDLM